MMDARNFTSRETLKNGLQVTFRAIKPDDRDALLAAFKELDDKTIYLRFFGMKKDISPKELKEATDIDFERTIALVTILADEAGERIIGAGRYLTFGTGDSPERAEVAFTVEEDYHGLGIASRLLRHLAGIAKQKGVKEFHAELLPENRGMFAVFSRSGFPLSQEIVEGVRHVTLSLGDDKS
jgi:GNAT superfamily N-acetyltransferase